MQEVYCLLTFVKSIKRFFSLKRHLLLLAVAAAVSSGAGYSVFSWLEKDVVIYDNGSVIACKTMKSTFEEVLDQFGIGIGEHDYVSTPPNTMLRTEGSNELYIKRAVPVYINADNKLTGIMTYKDTVEEMLEDSPVKPERNDRIVGAELKDRITSGMELRIIRVSESYEGETENIPYVIHRRPNKRMDEGTERISRHGQEGLLYKLFKVVTEDGKEVARQQVSETVIRDPVNMVVEYGTVLNFKNSRGEVVRYSKVLDMKATAYTASLKDTGKAPGHPLFGITATGMKAKKGIIAVDPKVIPLHTKMYVEILDKNTPDYGFCVAGDVGSAIKGNKIDLYYDSQDYVDRFGVKKVRVYILHDQ